MIVTLKKGWRFSEDGEPVRGFDTIQDAMEDVRAGQMCKCNTCISTGYR